MSDVVYESETSDPYRRIPQDLPPGESPSGDRSGHAMMVDDESYEGDSDEISSDEQLIQTAQTIYRASTDYMDSNITTVWEKNLAHFNNEHAPSTKFRSQSYKRSRVFRPKTRSMTKSSEAALGRSDQRYSDRVRGHQQGNPAIPPRSQDEVVSDGHWRLPVNSGLRPVYLDAAVGLPR
jgi:hypothetical protein